MVDANTPAGPEAEQDPQPSSSVDAAWKPLTVLGTDSKYPARAILDGQGIIVFRIAAGFRGVERACPHMQATMLNAVLVANESMIRCPLHVFTFKLADGKGVNCPGFKIRVYEIREENGALFGRPAN